MFRFRYVDIASGSPVFVALLHQMTLDHIEQIIQEMSCRF